MKYLIKHLLDCDYKGFENWDSNPFYLLNEAFLSQQEANNYIKKRVAPYYYIIISLEEAIKDYEVYCQRHFNG